MTFKEYLAVNKITLRQMGEKTKINYRTLHRYTAGVVPKVDNMQKIFKATKGKVKLEDWFRGNDDKKRD